MALDPATAVAVIGAGAMGQGIAQVAAVAGHPVYLFDMRGGAASAAIGRIAEALRKLVARSRIAAEDARAANGRLHDAPSLESLQHCGLFIEAIVEELETKRSLFAQLEALVPADAILATNTSSISITAIGSILRHPRRLAGMHFFNPAPVMPLVEIVRGAATDAVTAATLYATALRWSKTPVHARSSPGFIVNRVARPFYGESLRLLHERASDCATIDAILRDCGGFPMGPFELMDFIGHDVNYTVTRSIFEAFYGDPRYTPSLLQLELVEAGHLGRKTGRGFYTYGKGAAPIVPHEAPPSPYPSAVHLYGDHPFTTALAVRLGSAGFSFETRSEHPDARIADAGGFVLYRTTGLTATAQAAVTGITSTVLIDLVLDPARATRAAITIADQAGPGDAACAAGLLQAAGFAVSVIDDAPGMVVTRTVAMLANEAAEAVHQGVATAADCDLAMRKGVNYPLGPLEWADAIGLEEVVRILDNLDLACGDGRYRVSPLLRRRALSGLPLSRPVEASCR